MDEKEKKPKKKNIHSGHRHRVITFVLRISYERY